MQSCSDALYEALLRVLSNHGREDVFGNADFWLVDDNYGSPQHKVCVLKVSFLTRPIAAVTQRLLRRFSLPWEVLFVFETEGPRLDPRDVGVIVRKREVEERWDVGRMARTFGPEFRWGPRLSAR